MPRSIIQIGLHTSANWKFLTEENWLDYFTGKRKFRGNPEIPEEFRIPDFFLKDPEPFNFYGIDVDPESIAHVINKFENTDKNRVNWICAGIDDYINLKKTPHRYKRKDGKKKYYKFNLENKYLLFITMEELLKNLSLETFDILALDIDGYEHIIFDNMSSWCILPTLITVEYHGGNHITGVEWTKYKKENPHYHEEKKLLLKKISQNGYEIHKTISREERGRTLQEYQFLKTN